jgi:hypothetical protein
MRLEQMEQMEKLETQLKLEIKTQKNVLLVVTKLFLYDVHDGCHVVDD